MNIVRDLQERGIGFRSLKLKENIHLAPEGDKRAFDLIAAIADFNRRVVSERTREGMVVAKARGVHAGPHQSSAVKRSSGRANRSHMASYGRMLPSE